MTRGRPPLPYWCWAPWLPGFTGLPHVEVAVRPEAPRAKDADEKVLDEVSGRGRKTQVRDRGKPTGSTVKSGKALLFLFPFDFYHTCGLDPVMLNWKKHQVRFYPPFPNDGAKKRSLEQVAIKRIPRQAGTTPPHLNAPMLTSINVEMSGWEDSERGDALRMDVFGGDVDESDATRFVSRFLGIARTFTMQWWIARDCRPDEHYLRNTFAINEKGERLDGVISYAAKYAGFHIEKVMDRPIFESALIHASQSKEAPLAFLTLCDAVYHQGVGDRRRSIVDAAITAELLLGDEVPRFVERKGRSREAAAKRIDGLEFSDRLRKGLKDLLGHSFGDDRPDEAQWLETLWIARNNVAHGRPPAVVRDGVRREPTGEDYTSMIKAVIELAIWLQRFGRFEPREV